MNLLLDSHTLLRLMQSNPKLSATAAGLLADPANRLYLSMASILRDALSIVGVDTLFDSYGVTLLW